MILEKTWPDSAKRRPWKMLSRKMTSVGFIGDNLSPKEAMRNYVVLHLNADGECDYRIILTEKEWLEIKAEARKEGEI